jgi:hypothetical protein
LYCSGSKRFADSLKVDMSDPSDFATIENEPEPRLDRRSSDRRQDYFDRKLDAKFALLQEKIDALSAKFDSAFVNADFVTHRLDQHIEMERLEDRKKLKQYVIQGAALSAVLSIAVFLGAAVLTRFATVTLPNATIGATK